MSLGPLVFWAVVTIPAIVVNCDSVPVVQERSKDGKYIIEKDANPEQGKFSVYTSVHDLEKLFDREQEYIGHINTILDKKLVGNRAVTTLAMYVGSYDDIVGSQLEDKSFLANPLNAYNLIRHIAVGWLMVENALEEEKKHRQEVGAQLPKRVKKILARRQKEYIPDTKDLEGAATAIVRLHDFYRFNVSTFVRDGVIDIPGVVTTDPTYISAFDVLKMGTNGASRFIISSAVEMMEAGISFWGKDELSVPPFVPALERGTLRSLIKTAKTVHDQKLDQFGLTYGPKTYTYSFNNEPFDKRLKKKKKYLKLKEPVDVKLDLRAAGSRHEVEQYMALCGGAELRTADVTKKLYCYYHYGQESHTCPYCPRKVEVVSQDPYIAMVHEMITDSESSAVIKAADPKMRRSAVVEDRKDSGGKEDDLRISEQAWLVEWEVPSLDRLRHRLEALFRLKTLSERDAELYQVANYGLSGQYNSHHDAVLMGLDKNHKMHRHVFNINNGDRIATIMGYLSDVQVGGHTVFPLVGAFVKPRKGSVVIWWNMDQGGGHDRRMVHGGCPVLIGNKWITNKWPRAHNQMFDRKCPVHTKKEIRNFRQLGQKAAFFDGI